MHFNGLCVTFASSARSLAFKIMADLIINFALCHLSDLVFKAQWLNRAPHRLSKQKKSIAHHAMKSIPTKHWLLIIIACSSLQACVIFTVVDVATSAVVKTAGLVVDGAIGTVRVVGGVVGSVLPGGGDDKSKNTTKEKNK